VLGYHPINYPYLLFKDEDFIYLINAKNYTYEEVIKSKFKNRSGYSNCFSQTKEGEKLRILDLKSNNDKKVK